MFPSPRGFPHSLPLRRQAKYTSEDAQNQKHTSYYRKTLTTFISLINNTSPLVCVLSQVFCLKNIACYTSIYNLLHGILQQNCLLRHGPYLVSLAYWKIVENSQKLLLLPWPTTLTRFKNSCNSPCHAEVIDSHYIYNVQQLTNPI